MSRLEKLLQRIVNNPKPVRFEELDKLLKNEGFACRQSRKESSHFVYTKSVYVERAIDLLTDFFEEDTTDE